MKIAIDHLAAGKMDDFFSYLKDHISDNGKDNSPLFLPISRHNLTISLEQIESFQQGQSIPVGRMGWRRIMIATNQDYDIVGHVDLKSYPQTYTQHRALLGMGVHRDYRQIGLGSSLINSIIEWAKGETEIEAIDLWVLSENRPAIALYHRCGFELIGEVVDMFRIDGASLNYQMMTKKIK